MLEIRKGIKTYSPIDIATKVVTKILSQICNNSEISNEILGYFD